MKGQSKKQSLYEGITNIVVGVVISFILAHLLFEISALYNLFVTAIFTVASLVRSYILRHIFNTITMQNEEK